jgi:hypothetical protein
MRRSIIILFVFLLLLPTTALMAQTTSVTVGETIESTLARDTDVDVYSIELQSGQMVQIALASKDFDTVLKVFNAAAQEIARNDDGGYLRNEQSSYTDSLIDFVAPESGTYLIHVGGYSNRADGAYTLTVIEMPHQQISYGDEVTSVLSPEVSNDIYSFEANAGDHIAVSLNSSDFDAYLRLFDSENYLLTSDDDSGGDSNALIAGFSIPEDGTYRIHVSGYMFGNSGEYTLSLQSVELLPITFDTPLEVPVNDGVFLTFEAEVGQMIDIVANMPHLDMELTSPRGYWVAGSSYSYNEYDDNSIIRNTVLEENGFYRLSIVPGESSTETVTITIQETNVTSLEDGPVTLEFSQAFTDHIVGFSVMPGEQVRLTIRMDDSQQEGYFTPSLDLEITLGVETYSTYSIGKNVEASFILDLDHEGPVTLKFVNYAFSPATYEVTLERLSGE